MNAREREVARDELLHRAETETLLMGILNATPDSFSDGGQFLDTASAVTHAGRMISEGAAIIDVGGESTRPGAEPVTEEDERARTISLVSELVERRMGPVSIDTYKSAIANEAAEAGAVIINDVWGMTRDPDMAAAVASTGSAVVITYNRGQADQNINLVDDIVDFIEQRFREAEGAGIPRDHIWLDPGVGFSKTLEQNIDALRRLDVFLDFGCPVLVGVSRKSLIGLTLDRSVDDRLAGTIGAHLSAVKAGANIIRVHDVQEHADALKMYAILDGNDRG
ncbi:MAG: dihydropteroate synthase [Pseudomonadota bacterium]